MVHVLRAAVNVGLDVPDVTDFQLGTRGRHHLHDTDGPDAALSVLVELRFLVALRRQHEGIEVVLRAILAEQRERRLEPLLILRSRRIPDLVDAAVLQRGSAS
jgi:hypothetical protein